MTALEIIKGAIPDADENLASHILWGRTCFPVGQVTARDLYRAASAFRRATENGRRLCDWCHRESEPGKWTCTKCRKGLERHRTEREE